MSSVALSLPRSPITRRLPRASACGVRAGLKPGLPQTPPVGRASARHPRSTHPTPVKRPHPAKTSCNCATQSASVSISRFTRSPTRTSPQALTSLVCGMTLIPNPRPPPDTARRPGFSPAPAQHPSDLGQKASPRHDLLQPGRLACQHVTLKIHPVADTHIALGPHLAGTRHEIETELGRPQTPPVGRASARPQPGTNPTPVERPHPATTSCNRAT